MTITRRTLVLGAMTAPWIAQGTALAQSWPSGATIKLVVPFPPGGTVDPIARMAQPTLQKELGATVIVENRAGASGSVGTGTVAKSPPDGNTWLFVFDTHGVNPLLLNLPFDTVKDLAPVQLIGTAPYVLCTHPSRPYKTFADVVAAAKKKPKSITYGTVGTGSIGHLTVTLLAKRAGIELLHVPYRGGGPAMNDAIAGHVDLMIGSAALVTPQVKGGKVRAIMQTGTKRVPSLPDVQTAIEAGFTKFESYAWWGVFAPAGTPAPIVERFAKTLADALRDPKVSTTLTEKFQITLRLGGPKEQGKFLADQLALWGPVVKENNIKPD